jgi:hypothetical protein
MCQSDKRLDIKLRLGEIDRRFAELTSVSSKLAHMAERLARLRRVNERICLFIDRSSPSSRRGNDAYHSRKLRRKRSTQLSREYGTKVPAWH